MSSAANTPKSGFSNPDQVLIHRFLEQGGQPLPIDSNPMAIALGATLLAVDPQEGQVEIGFDPQPLFIQGTGVLQGGAISAMLDFAMAFATMARLPASGSCATTNISTSFLRPAPQGHYVATGVVDRCGKAMAFTQARLVEAGTGKLVATAVSTLVVMT